MKTLLMRAWRRFGAYGLALAAAWPRPGRCAGMSDKASPSRWRPTRPLSNDWSRPRTWRRARGWTNRTCSDGRFPRPGRPVPAWIRWRRKHCWARCCQRISMRARSSCRHICWANPPGRRRRRLRLALPAGMRALNVTVADLGPLAGRLRVGDSVDVYASFVHDGKRNAAPVLLAAGPVRRRAGRRWRAGHGERHAGGPPRGCPALRRCRQGGILTAMLRHRDDAVAVGDEDQADPAALQGMPPNPLRRAALSSSTETGWTAGRRAVRATDTASGQTGCDMALNRYRLAAMLGLCGCLAGVQAQTILVELEVGKAGCCPTGRAARGDRQRAGIARGRRRRAGNRHFRPRRGASPRCMSGRTLDGPPPMRSESCQQARRANVPRSSAARAHSVGPEHARRRQHRHRRRRSVRPGPRPHRRAGRALSVSAGPHGTGRLGPHGAAGRAGRGDPDLAPA